MSRRLLTLTIAVATACVVLSACSAGPALRHTSSTPTGTSSLFPIGPPTASPTHSPKPTHKPTTPPTTHKPTTPPTTAHPSTPSTAAPGTISAAQLGVAGAGTLRIPAWPDLPGMRYRGPDGSQGSTGTTSVALTFDDGPGPYTSQILDLLDHYHVKATFCLIGRQIPNYRAVIKRMINDGMTLCNHSWDHDEHMGTHNAAYIVAELQRTLDAVHAIDPHAQVTYFRNPAGNFTPGTVRISELLGMRPLYWTEDTADWTRPGVPAIEKSLLTVTHRDSIVLLHDAGGDRTETIAALQAVMDQLKSRFHLIALPTARTVRINPGKPAAPKSPSQPATPASVPPSTPATPANYRR